MGSYNVVVRSLEEDLRDIGILREDAGIDAGVVVNDEDDDFNDLDLEDEEDPELEEGRIRRRQKAGGGGTIALKRMSGTEKRLARAWRRSSAGRQSALKQARKMKKPRYKKWAKKRQARGERLGTVHDDFGLDRITDLIHEIRALSEGGSEDVQGDVEHVLTESLEGFGLIQEVAALLSEAFYFFSEEDEDEDLWTLADNCVDLANLSGSIVDLIEDGDVGDLNALVESFREQFGALLEACEVYEAIVEEEDDDQGEDDDEIEDSDDDDE